MSLARWWRDRFGLTPQERSFLVAVLAIALVGLATRHVVLSRQEADSYTPPEPVKEAMR